jgi:hypothetical protein
LIVTETCSTPDPASADDPGAGDPAGPRPNLIVGVAP